MGYNVAMFEEKKHLHFRLTILTLLCLSFVLAAIRSIVNPKKGPISHLFLMYNVGLAVIPSLLLYKYRNWKNKNLNNNYILNCFVFFVAFIFMPNSFYVITDFIHISRNSYISGYGTYRTYLVNVAGYIDLMNVFVCAITATILGLRQVEGINKILAKDNTSKIILLIFESILISIAIYVGRFIRLNSWDILSLPRILIEHRTNTVDIQFVFVYAVLILGLNIAYMIYKQEKKITRNIGQSNPLNL